MTDSESPDARRHRWARSLRAVSSVHTAALLLEAYDAALLEEHDVVPCALDEIESLEDWSYGALLAHCIARAPAPAIHAQDLLNSRRYVLIGLLAQATEDAVVLGDRKTAKQMARLTNTALLRIIGGDALRVALGTDREDNGCS